MSSRRTGKSWGNQSKYQPSREGKQEALNRVLAKYKKAKPKLSINIGRAEQVAGSIGSYRKSKSATSFVATNKVLQNLKSRGLSEDNPLYKTYFRTVASKGFREFTQYVESEDIKVRFEQIKKQNPSFTAPYESKLYNEIKLLQKAIESSPDNKGLQKQYDEALKSFMSDQISTPEAVDELLRYYNEQNQAIKSIYENSAKLKNQYSEFEDFVGDFWQVYRQALARNKMEYDSSSLLTMMMSSNGDYLFENMGDTEATQERIREGLSKYMEQGLGRLVPDIPQSFLVKQAPRKSSNVETIKPKEHVKPRVNKNADWFESLTTDEDRDELIGYAPEKKMRDYSKIYQMFPTKGDIENAKEIMTNAKKSELLYGLRYGSSIPLDDGSFITLLKIKKPSLQGYQAVYEAMNENPDFNKYNTKDLLNVVIKFSELMGEEDE